ncbi:hypothetical protein M406DRAFT_334068 [Cryphonectria parasitica EP155]|uniref:Uncharacterized protein n=1 Tax=Cryphonectria parasitica (strain ATCC 38755 / EP155) TaxID=660469 RepID=A0A9P5CKF8_CRYP1|nr:uncharacterized protein M406DRAFT_334068 [Cryphonectria parasitica EP155]KAF3762033.1 hypothetical protein M406DRAFT_334068 [Cryphonectria parasitica EP155]
MTEFMHLISVESCNDIPFPLFPIARTLARTHSYTSEGQRTGSEKREADACLATESIQLRQLTRQQHHREVRPMKVVVEKPEVPQVKLLSAAGQLGPDTFKGEYLGLQEDETLSRIVIFFNKSFGRRG